MTAKKKSKKVTKLKLHKPNPKTKKVVFGEVFTVNGVMDYNFTYKNQAEGMALYLYLGKMQEHVSKALFSKKEAPKEEG